MWSPPNNTRRWASPGLLAQYQYWRDLKQNPRATSVLYRNRMLLDEGMLYVPKSSKS